MTVHRLFRVCLIALLWLPMFGAAQPGPVHAIATRPHATTSLLRRIGNARPRPDGIGVNTVLTLSASPSSVSFTLVPGGAASASAAIAITSVLQNAALTSVLVYAWLPSASAALATANGSSIPSSCVLGQVPTGVPTSATAFTQSNALGIAGAGLKLVSLPNLSSSLSETDNLYLRIDLTSLPQLPAGNYTGALYLQAQAL